MLQVKSLKNFTEKVDQPREQKWWTSTKSAWLGRIMKLDSLMRMRIVYKMLRIVIQAGSRLKKATVGAGGWPGAYFINLPKISSLGALTQYVLNSPYSYPLLMHPTLGGLKGVWSRLLFPPVLRQQAQQIFRILKNGGNFFERNP